ncbi:MAG: hypothetical protein Q8M07_25800 [Prosthecobacter sp.]|nr:hypothetical protein [Prosthecobacter sp.]
MSTPASLPRFWFRLLTFRASAGDYGRLHRGHLIAGLITCWLVGIGRYWDDTRASLLQHTGIGSVIYVFVLAAVMWIVVKPVAPERFTYSGILTFITLTSPPAALYAIPVEKWMTLQDANLMNLRFLGIVALWRLVLWMHYLRRHGQLSAAGAFCVAAVPLAAIFITLVNLNLHHAVVNVMGGIREADKTSQDAAYGMLNILAILSLPVSFIACLGWLWMALESRSERKMMRAIKLTASSKSVPPSTNPAK